MVLLQLLGELYLFVYFLLKRCFSRLTPNKQIVQLLKESHLRLNMHSSDFQDNHIYGYCYVGRKVRGEEKFSFKCNINENCGQKLSIQMWCDGFVKSDVFISVWKLLPRSAVLHWIHNNKTRDAMFHVSFFFSRSFTIFNEHKSSMIIVTNINMRRKKLWF